MKILKSDLGTTIVILIISILIPPLFIVNLFLVGGQLIYRYVKNKKENDILYPKEEKTINDTVIQEEKLEMDEEKENESTEFESDLNNKIVKTEKCEEEATEKDEFDEEDEYLEKTPKDRKKLKKIIAITISIVIIASCVIIPLAVALNRRKWYRELASDMEYFCVTGLFDGINEIEEDLSHLPKGDWGDDIYEYREQFEDIKKNIKIIDDYFVVTGMNNGSDGHGLNEADSEEARKAYAELVEMKNSYEYSAWNFKYCFEKIDICKIVFGVKWEGEYYFKWFEMNGANDKRLLSTFPDKADSEKEYYYTVNCKKDSILFGSENKKDSEDSFDDFRVFNLKYKDGVFSVDVYCYEKDAKYTLKYVM